MNGSATYGYGTTVVELESAANYWYTLNVKYTAVNTAHFTFGWSSRIHEPSNSIRATVGEFAASFRMRNSAMRCSRGLNRTRRWRYCEDLSLDVRRLHDAPPGSNLSGYRGGRGASGPEVPGEYCELRTANGAGYSRSNTSTSGSLRPGACTVIISVFRSGETLISRVSMTFPPTLSVISRVCSSVRRIEEEE